MSPNRERIQGGQVNSRPAITLVILLGLQWLPIAQAEEATPIKRYSTPEERREAGVAHAITDWLSITTLIEVEYGRDYESSSEPGGRVETAQTDSVLQAAINLDLQDWWSAEIVYEYDVTAANHTIDELSLLIEWNSLELELGRLNVPFGEYFSYFSTGPILEFGETRGDTLILSWEALDNLELSVFGYQGRARDLGDHVHIDWGTALEWGAAENFNIGLSFLSDLTDSNEQLLEETNNLHSGETPAYSGWLQWTSEHWEATAEFVAAAQRIPELDETVNQPVAWNTELAWFPDSPIDYSARLEGSRRLADAAKIQAGISLNWRALPNTIFTLDFLSGEFRSGVATDSRDRPLERRHSFAWQLSIGF